MNAVDRLLSLDLPSLKIWKTHSGNIAVSYENCDIKDGIFLVGEFGVGKNFNEACEDYLKKISGKTLVFHSNKKEVTVL